MRTAFGLTWDHIGLVVAISVTIAAIILAIGSIWDVLPPQAWGMRGALVVVLWSVLMLLVGGTFGVAWQICAREEVAWGDLFRNAARLWRASLMLSILHLAFVFLIGINFRFYGHLGLAGQLGAMVCLYITIFWLMMGAYQYPLIAAQELGALDDPGHQARRGAGAALKRSFFLTIGDPMFAAELMGMSLIVFAIMLVSVLPMMICAIPLLAICSCQGARAQLVRYGVLAAFDTGEPPPDSRAYQLDDRSGPSHGTGREV
ncbi:MAG: hypothetical protein KGJ62_11505 [Armatimonadetes bacterium]|nr:hypothetical protein [Armatimonadota bacterium]